MAQYRAATTLARMAVCLALGGLFAYELFLFSDAFITPAGSILASAWGER